MSSRQRVIHPNIWHDRKFRQLDHVGQRMFIGVITLADDAGDLEWDPQYINRAIFNNALSEDLMYNSMLRLESLEMVRAYIAESGQSYAAIPNFHKYQKPTFVSYPECPMPPDGWPWYYWDRASRSKTMQERLIETFGKKPTSRWEPTCGKLPLDYCSKHYKSSSIKFKNGELPVENVENSDEGGCCTAEELDELADNLVSLLQSFSRLWNAYPEHRRKGHTEAQDAWIALEPSPTLTITILDNLEHLKLSKKWSIEGGRYVPALKKFIQQRLWES